MRVFKTKWFSRFARQEDVADTKLVEAVRNIENGLVDADYGGGLIKQRIARDGEGRSGGYRGIIDLSLKLAAYSYLRSPKARKKISLELR